MYGACSSLPRKPRTYFREAPCRRATKRNEPWKINEGGRGQPHNGKHGLSKQDGRPAGHALPLPCPCHALAMLRALYPPWTHPTGGGSPAAGRSFVAMQPRLRAGLARGICKRSRAVEDSPFARARPQDRVVAGCVGCDGMRPGRVRVRDVCSRDAAEFLDAWCGTSVPSLSRPPFSFVRAHPSPPSRRLVSSRRLPARPPCHVAERLSDAPAAWQLQGERLGRGVRGFRGCGLCVWGLEMQKFPPVFFLSLVSGQGGGRVSSRARGDTHSLTHIHTGDPAAWVNGLPGLARIQTDSLVSVTVVANLHMEAGCLNICAATSTRFGAS